MNFLVDSGKDNGNLLLLRHFTKSGQVMDTRRVDKRNFTHTDDTYFRTVTQLRHRFFELRGDAKEVRTVDFIYFHSFGDYQILFVYGDIELRVRINLVRDNRNLGSLHNTFHKEYTSDDKSDFDGNCQVEDNSKEECDQKYRYIRFWIFQ